MFREIMWQLILHSILYLKENCTFYFVFFNYGLYVCVIVYNYCTIHNFVEFLANAFKFCRIILYAVRQQLYV